MAGSITHNYILFKSLSGYSGSNEYIKKIIASNKYILDNYAKDKKGYKKYLTDPACCSAGYAYLGCFGPDMFYLEEASEIASDFLHYNKTGPYVADIIINLRKNLLSNSKLTDIYRFAYCLGHSCHIAADVVVHPFVNSIVGAYPDNDKKYKNAQGLAPKIIWKFHNILEHYQDAYVLYKKFINEENFYNSDNVNIASAAAAHIVINPTRAFLGTNVIKYYNNSPLIAGAPAGEIISLQYLLNKNWVVDFNKYISNAMPDEEMMLGCPSLVQENVFNNYINSAIELTRKMWDGIGSYLETGKESDLNVLNRHWNLDTGLYPEITPSKESFMLKYKQGIDVKNLQIRLPATLTYKSYFETKVDYDVDFSLLPEKN